MVLDTEVTFPEVTLCCSGVHLQDRTSITAYLHLYIGLDRGFPDRRLLFPAKSSVDILSLCRAIESKVADYPRSFTKRKIFHARSSDNPRSMTMTNLAPASVSTCNSKRNSKRIIPPLFVTDRDVSQRPQLTSHSVTARTVSSLFVLQIETNLKLGWHHTR